MAAGAGAFADGVPAPPPGLDGGAGVEFGGFDGGAGAGGEPAAEAAGASAVQAAGALAGPAARRGPTGVAWARQVHGATVLVVDGTARRHDVTGRAHVAEGDALVSVVPDARVAVLTADCASIALASPEGLFAAVHAGWRGLVAGVVERAADVLRAHGATDLVGALGPCIHPECYEFAEADLRLVADRYGDGVRGRTARGTPALDLPAAVHAALGRAGVEPVPGVDACTACGGPYFSHRARGDGGRQALVVWSGGAEGRSEKAGRTAGRSVQSGSGDGGRPARSGGAAGPATAERGQMGTERGRTDGTAAGVRGVAPTDGGSAGVSGAGGAGGATDQASGSSGVRGVAGAGTAARRVDGVAGAGGGAGGVAVGGAP